MQHGSPLWPGEPGWDVDQVGADEQLSIVVDRVYVVPGGSVPRVRDLDDFLKCYEQATNSHDFDRVAPLIADDAVYWFSDGAHEGITAIRAAFEAAWATIVDEDYRISDVRWVAVDDTVATCIYAFRWSGVVDGQPRSGIGRGTNVLARRDGRWVMVHEHLSS